MQKYGIRYQLILNVQPLINILNISFAIGTPLNVHVKLVFYVMMIVVLQPLLCTR